MEYRQLGRSGLRISTLTMGTMTFGGKGGFANVGETDVAEARRQDDACLDAGGNIIDPAGLYSQVARTEGRGPDGRGPVAPRRDLRRRGEPAPPADRPHRPLPGPRVGRAHADRGDAVGARRPPPVGEGALRRLR